jgi:DNA-binding NtrC family response regulator
MRPKTIILCVDENEQELSIMKFTLETNGYRVITAPTADKAIATFSTTYDIRMVLIADYAKHLRGWMTGKQLLVKMKAVNEHVPMVLLGEAYTSDAGMNMADALVSKEDCSTEKLLGLIHSMTIRKRGPRKGFKYPRERLAVPA